MTGMNKLISAAPCAALVLALLGCGGRGSSPVQSVGGVGPVLPMAGAFDPARAEVMYGSVLRTSSGLPTGIKVTWAAQADAVSYNVYRGSAAILDSARGNAALQVATAL